MSEALNRAKRKYRKNNWDFTMTVTPEERDFFDHVAEIGSYKDGVLVFGKVSRAEMIRSAIRLKMDMDNRRVVIHEKQ